MQRSVLEMGGLTILLATTAMIWNIIYNALFDRLWPTHLVKRTAKVRAFHALGFESGFIVIGVSIMAYVLNVSLLQAFTPKLVSSCSSCRTPCFITGRMTHYASA